ncbi:MAG: hypothetical protein Kow00124_29500 [Anaerolineae bacterium]
MDDQRSRLPLPGSQPSTVYDIRRQRSVNPWRRTHPGPLWNLLPLARLALVALIILTAWRAARTPVTIIANGQPIDAPTHRRTVEGALRSAGIPYEGALFVSPPPEAPLTPGMVITVAHPGPLLLHADGGTYTVEASTTDVRAIVRGVGLTLSPVDQVEVIRALRPTRRELETDPALLLIPPLPREIVVRRPATLIITEGETRVSLQTTAPTIGAALARAGYTLYEGDVITPPLWTPLEAGGAEVTIERAVPVTLRADGRVFSLRTHQPTVAALLAERGLTLAGQDYALPTPESPLQPGMQIDVVRVEEQTLIDTEPLPYETVYVPDPAAALDDLRVIREGREGLLRRQVRVRRENGVEVSRRPAAEWVERPPEARVVAYGTQITLRTLQTPYGTVEYWRTLRVLATSYSPLTAGHKQPGDPGFGIAAAGVEVQRGVVAVDPRVINLYTWMYIPGYGIGRALDTGGAIKGMRIDLGYADADYYQRYEWIDIYLLTPVPPYDQINWVLPQQ